MENTSFGRLIGVLVSPIKTFRSIAQRPTWGVALIVLAVVSTGFGLLFSQRTDWGDVTRQAIAESKQDVPPEAADRQIKMMEKAGPVIGPVAGLLGTLLIVLVIALVFWVALKLLGGEFDFVHSLAVAAHACLPLALGSLLTLPALLTRPAVTFRDTKLGLLPTNLAWLAPEGVDRRLFTLLGSLDLLSFWVLALLVVGYGSMPKVSRGKAAATVLAVWALFVLLKLGWVSIFNR